MRIGLFENIILKPNVREAASAVQPDVTGEPERATAEAAAAALYARTGQPVFLTLGGDGIMAFHADGPTHIPAVPVTGPIDIVGAGDATMAGIASGAVRGRHRRPKPRRSAAWPPRSPSSRSGRRGPCRGNRSPRVFALC